MALKLNSALKSVILNGVRTELGGTSGTANVLSLYTGAQPADPDGGTSGTLLCIVAPVTWTATTSGTANLAAYGYGTATVAGTIGHGRMGTGTSWLNGGAGTATTCTFVLDNEVITVGGIVRLKTCSLYMS